ncbi:hypothetical protein F5Y08DRAFT_335462 [Xylaria arbuscula]|nr:hypothetical protein F5Y08DRAFT_335462 [Xylaria arbuscula]
MEQRGNEHQASKQADSTGLVAMIVVLVLLVLGGTAAYLLMRWHFANRRARIGAAGAELGGGQGLGAQNNTFTTPGEKLYSSDALAHVEEQEYGVGSRRSVVASNI